MHTINLESLNEIAIACNSMSRSKGFWDDKVNIGEKLMLVNTELCEAFETYRKELVNKTFEETIVEGYEKKDSFVDEIADVFIRLFDLCGQYNIDIAKQIKWKYQYNSNRAYKHGKAF